MGNIYVTQKFLDHYYPSWISKWNRIKNRVWRIVHFRQKPLKFNDVVGHIDELKEDEHGLKMTATMSCQKTEDAPYPCGYSSCYCKLLDAISKDLSQTSIWNIKGDKDV